MSFRRWILHPSAFPELWKIHRPPAVLYAWGSRRALEVLSRLPERGLAVVGTRYPLQRSLELVRESILDLASSQLVVVSGFARGIDAAAHEAALEAGLPTIAILGAGLDISYPSDHGELRRKILQADGLLVSEFPPDAPPLAERFLQRNRLIAGWSKAIWVVEAAARSGALNTARWAREHQRTCFATPCFPQDLQLAGNQNLLDDHQAIPFWRASSLGCVWLELAAQPPSRSQRGTRPFKRPILQDSDSNLLRAAHDVLVSEPGGGLSVQTLLDWAMHRNWAPQRFFTALENALNSGLLLDENGLLLKNPKRSD